ncbi:hypothetical protein [Mesorhizobium sp. M0768]|uniref:hypothetical protein n=1 Tax=Mesorhizobium sp. M0768 TaxID=2956996 RepID=UPI00333D6AC0
MEPEEARKAFLAAAEEEGTLRSPLIRAGDWKFIKTRDRKLVTEEVPSNFHPCQPIGSPLRCTSRPTDVGPPTGATMSRVPPRNL